MDQILGLQQGRHTESTRLFGTETWVEEEESQELASHGNKGEEQPLQACCLDQLSMCDPLRGWHLSKDQLHKGCWIYVEARLPKAPCMYALFLQDSD